MWKRRVPPLLFLTISSATACGDDDDEAGAAANYKASCRNACVRINECDSTRNIDDCSTECENDLATIGPNLSHQYARAVDACIAEADCVMLLQSLVSNTCDSEARASIGATPAATAFCEAAAEATRECSIPWLSNAACIDAVKIFSDRALSDATACRDRPCGDRLDCVIGELGITLAATQ